jgi:hypothetical protein
MGSWTRPQPGHRWSTASGGTRRSVATTSSGFTVPITLLKTGRDAIEINTFRLGELRLKRIPNSVNTLAPTNRFVLAINTIPIAPGVPYHTIMGDRGKGDAPNSSDGVVPYWSSHMGGAKSELIVSSEESLIGSDRICQVGTLTCSGLRRTNDTDGAKAQLLK